MTISVDKKEFKKAFNYVWSLYTAKEQKETQVLFLRFDQDTLTIMGVKEDSKFDSTIKVEGSLLENLSVQVKTSSLLSILDMIGERLSFSLSEDNIHVTSEVEDDSVSFGRTDVVFPEGDRAELFSASHDDLLSIFSEPLSSPLKTARSFTDTLLLRLRKDRLNARNITLQTIVITSIKVETDNKGIVDTYLSKKDAQAINKALKNMKKTERVSVLKEDEFLVFKSEDYTYTFRYREHVVDIPDITSLMSRCLKLNADEGMTLSVDKVKKNLSSTQKETDKEERDTLNCSLIDVDSEIFSQDLYIPVKETLKILKSLNTKSIECFILEKALVFKYQKEDRIHCSVITFIKKGLKDKGRT